jgi:hypothetical protein
MAAASPAVAQHPGGRGEVPATTQAGGSPPSHRTPLSADDQAKIVAAGEKNAALASAVAHVLGTDPDFTKKLSNVLADSTKSSPCSVNEIAKQNELCNFESETHRRQDDSRAVISILAGALGIAYIIIICLSWSIIRIERVLKAKDNSKPKGDDDAGKPATPNQVNENSPPETPGSTPVLTIGVHNLTNPKTAYTPDPEGNTAFHNFHESGGHKGLDRDPRRQMEAQNFSPPSMEEIIQCFNDLAENTPGITADIFKDKFDVNAVDRNFTIPSTRNRDEEFWLIRAPQGENFFYVVPGLNIIKKWGSNMVKFDNQGAQERLGGVFQLESGSQRGLKLIMPAECQIIDDHIKIISKGRLAGS